MAACTRIVDIDGVIIKHEGQGACHQWWEAKTLLPGVKEAFQRWEENGDMIIILTGRRESQRDYVEALLASLGLFYNVLIMGAPRGPRIVYNDAKPDGSVTCRAVCIERNKGLPCERE